VIYTPPGQQGFGQPLQASGWLRASPRLTATLTRLGVPAGTSLPSTPRPATTAPSAAPTPAGATAPAWLIATIVAAVAVAIGGLVLWRCRRSRPATDRLVADRPASDPGHRGDDRRAVTPWQP
jgi:hypothetical protein